MFLRILRSCFITNIRFFFSFLRKISELCGKYRNYAEDADFSELCGSASPHPVRCHAFRVGSEFKEILFNSLTPENQCSLTRQFSGVRRSKTSKSVTPPEILCAKFKCNFFRAVAYRVTTAVVNVLPDSEMA